jgi:uncharacterized delta-60 repeat protein
MKHLLKGITIIASICYSNTLKSQNLILDSLFSENGFGFYSTFANNKLLELYKLEDDKFLACGNEHSFLPPPASGSPINSIIKFTECGTVDSSYGINGRFENNYEFFEGNIEGMDFYLNSDGSLFLAGETIKNINNISYRSQALLKIDSSGILDSNFILNDISMLFNSMETNNGSSAFCFVEVLSDDKIICAGKYQFLNDAGLLIARFNSSGLLDSSYHSTGFILIPNESIDFRLSKAHRVAENKILFVGTNQDQVLVTCRVNDNGMIDSTYGINGFVVDTSSMINDRYSKIDDNNLVIASKFNDGLSNSEPINIKRFLPDGSPDTSFGNAGTFWLESSTNQDCIGFDILNDHRIVIGILYQNGINYLGRTYIINENGGLDTNFSSNGELISNFNNNETAYSEVIELEDGRLILGGLNNIQRGCIISRYSNSSLLPNLTINGSYLISGVNSNSVIHYWYYNGEEIQNQNASTIEFSANGEYVVTVIDTIHCGEYSDTLSINILSSTKKMKEEPMIFPNPAYNIVKTNGIALNNSYAISDISGRTLKSGRIKNEQELIDCSDLIEGSYILRLSSGQNLKLIINR